MKNNFSLRSILIFGSVMCATFALPSQAEEKSAQDANKKISEVAPASPDVSQALNLITMSAFKINESKRQTKLLMSDIETQMGKLVDNVDQISEAQIRELFKALAQVTEFDTTNSIGQVLEIFVNSKRSKLITKILSEVDTKGTLKDALDRVEKDGNS